MEQVVDLLAVVHEEQVEVELEEEVLVVERQVELEQVAT